MADLNLLRRHTNINLDTNSEYIHTNGRAKKCRTCGKWRHFKFFENNEARCITCKRQREAYNNKTIKTDAKMAGLIQKRVRAALARAFKSHRQIERPNITVMYMFDLYVKQNGLCALTGRRMTLGIVKTNSMDMNALSIDRIDSNRGYIQGNVQLVTYQANVAKGRFSNEDLYVFCKDVIKRLEDPKPLEGESLAQILEREGLPLPPSLDFSDANKRLSEDQNSIGQLFASKRIDAAHLKDAIKRAYAKHGVPLHLRTD